MVEKAKGDSESEKANKRRKKSEEMNSLFNYVKDRIAKERSEEAKALAAELHNFEHLTLSDAEDGEVGRA